MAVLVLAAAIGINAQTSTQYEAEIPFSFEVRGQQHAPGAYRLEKSPSGSSLILLRDVDRGKMSALSAYSVQGNSNWKKPAMLVFQKVNGV